MGSDPTSGRIPLQVEELNEALYDPRFWLTQQPAARTSQQRREVCRNSLPAIGEERKGWRGVEWSGVEWSGVEWSGVEWCGVVWRGVEWCGVVCDGV